MRTFALYFAAEFMVFLLATLNFRYCAKGRITPTVTTDVMIATFGFLMIRLVAEATAPIAMVGYVVGAGCGSVTAMHLTKRLEER